MRLGELERAVMEVLWQSHCGLAAREVAESLASGPATTTVLTVLDRLAGKGLVTRIKQGRAHLYSPAASKEEFLATAMHTALGEADDRGAVLTRFIDSVGTQEIADLRRALQEFELADAAEEEPGGF